METVFQAMGSSSQPVKTAEDAFCGTGRAVKSRNSSNISIGFSLGQKGCYLKETWH